MAVKGFFNRFIMPREDWRNLEKEKDRLLKAVIARNEEIERLNKLLETIKKNERCKGKHCDSCKNACKSHIVEYMDIYGYSGQRTDVICLLDVQCPDYKRKEE